MLKMKMNRYWIENIEYLLDPQYLTSNQKINLSPKIAREINNIDDNRAIVKLIFELKKENDYPFGIKITICGEFECPNWKTSDSGMYFMNSTSVQTLFPYLRQAVSTITGLSNIPQYCLPIVNVHELFS